MASVLVIDDEPGILRFVLRALQGQGHTVTLAADGLRGLRAFADTEPDLVVLDLVMPGMDGLDVLAAMIAARPAARVLVLSAVGDLHARDRCVEAGAVDFLAKPFGVAELLARVDACLRERPADPSARLQSRDAG